MVEMRAWRMLGLLMLIALLSGCARQSVPALLPDDPLDPLAKAVAPLPFEALRDRPLMRRATDFEGLLFLSELQVGLLDAAGVRLQVLLEKPCHAVIAVNRERTAMRIAGYRQLLDSELIVAMPHNDSDAGKTLVAALAFAFGAQDGDLSDGYAYLSALGDEGRLLIPGAQDRETLTARAAGDADAVLLWDYQAQALQETGNWEIVLPGEGVYHTRRLLVAPEPQTLPEALAERLLREGWRAPSAPADAVAPALLRAMSSFKPDFRRSVLGGAYRYTTASVVEKSVANALITLAMVMLAAWTSLRIRNRAPLRPYLALMGGLVFWLILCQIKLVAWRDEAIVALWYATYPCIMLAAMAWYALCHALRHPEGLSRRRLWWMAGLHLLSCALVATNSLHEQVFRFSDAGNVFWYNNYTYGWGYWVFFAVIAAFLAAGLVEYARYALQRRRWVQFAVFLCGLAMILAVNLLNAFYLRLGLLLDVAWQTNLLASLTVLGASRAGFLDPALPWRAMIDRLRLPVAIWKNDALLYRSTAYLALEPSLGVEVRDGGPLEIGERWYQKTGREFDGYHTILWEDVSDQRAARQALLKAQELAEQNRRLSEERLASAQALLKRLSGIVENSGQRRILDNGLNALREAMLRLEGNPSDTQGALRARLLAGHCARALRLALMGMEARRVSGGALDALMRDACLEARGCGIDAAISCSVDETVDADVAAALSLCLCALLEACLGRSDPTGASFRVLRQGGRLRLVALLPAAIDPSAAFAVADGLAAVCREADDQTLILKYDFAEVL